jgi:hypothetical protein
MLIAMYCDEYETKTTYVIVEDQKTRVFKVSVSPYVCKFLSFGILKLKLKLINDSYI